MAHHATGGSDYKPNLNTLLYSPYGNLNLSMQTLYKLPTSPEFLFSEESVHQHQSWGENLTFYTGLAYLAGSVTGAGIGLFSAFKSMETGDTMKLKINRVLNSSGHSVQSWGNRIGVIGLIYAGLESGVVVVMDWDDVGSSVGLVPCVGLLEGLGWRLLRVCLVDWLRVRQLLQNRQ